MTPTPDGPRIEVDSYVVYPTGYDEMVHSDKDAWCLTVSNGHAWGWRITRGINMSGQMAMNRHGKFIVETRRSGHNKQRRWPLDLALIIARDNVDRITLNGWTAQQASNSIAEKLAVS